MPEPNTQPIIFHIDVNSAFLSWSALARLEAGDSVDLRTLPSIIGGDIENRHGVVLAKSIPAKAFGIVTGEPVTHALQKCPSLIIEPPAHDLYTMRSHQLMDYLQTYTPDIEQASIDECYMNYNSIDRRILAQFRNPVELATHIKDEVRNRFGFTVNVGISDRKVLAKMASDFRKPDLVHTLYVSEIKKKLWPLPISSLFMCGHSSADTLRKLGIETIGDLAHTDLTIITSHLKSHGRLLWEYANGIDSSGVESVPTEAKGIGNSTTLSADALTREAACRVLLSLSESVARRLRASGQNASMVSTEIKYATFKKVSHQTTLVTPTNTTDIIYQTACSLFDELWDGSPVRLLGIRTSKLTDIGEPVQMELSDFLNQNDKKKKLDEAVDLIRQKYGKDAIMRGSFLSSPSSDKK